jgi:hypothetical protein
MNACYNILHTRDESKKEILNSNFRYVPTELLMIILEYFTKEYQGLLWFRCICKEWKDVAEYSSLWLEISLSFYCPGMRMGDHCVHLTVLDYHSNMQFKHNKFSVVVSRSLEGLSHFKALTPRYQAYQTCLWFVDTFTSWNRYWQEYFSKWDYYAQINRLFESYITMLFVLTSSIVMVGPLIATILFQYFPSATSAGFHFGFVFIYLTLIVYIFSVSAGFFHQRLQRAIDNDDLDMLRISDWIIEESEVNLLGPGIALLLVAILIHVKLTYGPRYLYWIFCMIPIIFPVTFWLLQVKLYSTSITFFTFFSEQLRVGISIGPPLGIVLTSFLLAVYYDTSSRSPFYDESGESYGVDLISSPGYAFIPLYPTLAGVFLAYPLKLFLSISSVIAFVGAFIGTNADTDTKINYLHILCLEIVSQMAWVVFVLSTIELVFGTYYDMDYIKSSPYFILKSVSAPCLCMLALLSMFYYLITSYFSFFYMIALFRS